MPCSDSVYDSRYDTLRETNEELREKYNQLKERLDKVTQNLCFLCGELIEAKQFQRFSNKRIREWQKEHHKSDIKRVTIRMEVYYQNEYGATAKECANTFIASAEKEHPVSNYHKKWFLRLAKQVKRNMN